MARLPELKRLKMEDIPDAPSWLEPIFYTINKFMESVYLALNKKIDYENNLQVQTETLTFYGRDITTLSIKVQNRLGKVPKFLLLGNITKIGTGSHVAITLPVTIDWNYDGNYIIIHNITNLDDSTQYQANIIIL